jgi:hypothetical protein
MLVPDGRKPGVREFSSTQSPVKSAIGHRYGVGAMKRQAVVMAVQCLARDVSGAPVIVAGWQLDARRAGN